MSLYDDAMQNVWIHWRYLDVAETSLAGQPFYSQIVYRTVVAICQGGPEGRDQREGWQGVNINGTRVALFFANGKYYAIEALCRHQDGSLAPGKIDGEVVECPLHSWHYNIRTGELLDYMEGVKLTTYKLDIRGNDIYLEV